MSQSSERAVRAMYLAVIMTVLSFLWNVTLTVIGTLTATGHASVPLAYLALLSLLAGATAALTGNGPGACLTFVLSGALAALAWWAALLPAAVVVAYRVVRRAMMLAQADRTAPRRGPRPGFWKTLQAWAGWSLREAA
ncbi:hypothetical protein AB0G49_14320 [Streptomyces longwoodensis]|uniref:hypothetical protein n=1 Tax=Streptomyces longwoodensis TaxID=68231 RepID=UPI0033DC70BF